jgi:hypothetical protein
MKAVMVKGWQGGKGVFPVGGDVDIVAGITNLREQVARNTKLEQRSFGYLPP